MGEFKSTNLGRKLAFIGGRIQNMSEVKEPCGKCGHPLSLHTRDTRGCSDLSESTGGNIFSDTFVGQSGCTECDWSPSALLEKARQSLPRFQRARSSALKTSKSRASDWPTSFLISHASRPDATANAPRFSSSENQFMARDSNKELLRLAPTLRGPVALGGRR
jgi:hypothetical protein